MGVRCTNNLPPPPADLASRRLPLKEVGGTLFRIHHSARRCLYFGKDGSGRFDDPLREYGVLYATFEPEGAFGEVFLRELPMMLVAESDLQARSLSEIVCRAVQIVDLTGQGLRRLPCDNRISTEKPYLTTGRWSRALFDHPQRPDGITDGSAG
jgi:hypothetical protein